MEDITKKVMDRVVGWERRRMVIMLAAAAAILVVTLAAAAAIVREIGERQVLAELAILGEDWEVVRRFGTEVMRTVWEELPHVKLGVILGAGIVGWGLWGKWPAIKKKISYLAKHK